MRCRSWQAWVSYVRESAGAVRRAEAHRANAQQLLKREILQQWYELSRQLATAREAQVHL